MSDNYIRVGRDETTLSGIKIATAASKNADGDIIASPRHYDSIFHLTVKMLTAEKQAVWNKHSEVTQGFLTNRGKFVDRKEALKIARAAGQILKKSGNPDSDELFSEDLY